jgi:hypothetical protein
MDHLGLISRMGKKISNAPKSKKPEELTKEECLVMFRK